MSVQVWNKGVSLSEYSTFQIGGNSRFFVVVETVDQMQQAIIEAKQRSVPYFILGKGSNCLFADQGFDGVVIQNKISYCSWIDEKRVCAGAGYSFSLLGAKASRKGLSGLEFASGIPASVGGAVFMNAGANQGEVSDVLLFCTVVDQSGKIVTYQKEQLSFSYRKSCFQERKETIVEATFQLEHNQGAKQKQESIIQYRMSTQPYEMPSAGCIFQNPGQDVSAGQLIDKAGLKGYTIGDAMVSEKHANFFVNKSSARAKDVEKLIHHVQEEVWKRFGIFLVPEVRQVREKRSDQEI